MANGRGLFGGAFGADTEGLSELAFQLNLRRAAYVALATLLFLALNLVNNPLSHGPVVTAGYWSAGTLCVAYVICFIIFRDRLADSPNLGRAVFLAFWSLLLASMSFFFAHDLRAVVTAEYSAPASVVLYCAAMTIVPVLTRLETLAFFSAFALINVVLALISDAPSTYYMFIFALSLVGLAFSYEVQHQNFMLLWKYKSESRLDELTGVLNRKGGLERIKVMLSLCNRHKEPVALYMVDIDDFKLYNDNFGHQQGDVALRMVADALNGAFTRASDVVCRYGGEEFVICASIADRDSALLMAKRLQESVAALKLNSAAHPGDYLAVSVGIAHYLPDLETRPVSELDLIERADNAMLRAKRNGKRRAEII